MKVLWARKLQFPSTLAPSAGNFLREVVTHLQSRLRDATGEARKMARQLGNEGALDAGLLTKADQAKELAEEVTEICEKRAALLEQVTFLIPS